MTALTAPPPSHRAATTPVGAALPVLLRYLRETRLLVGRGLRTIPRVPMRLSDVTVQPIVFTLLFLYVFGSAIHVPGMHYQDYLLPGMLAQSVAFGVIGSGVATATDFTAGVVDRFTSLPITRLSVVTAQLVGQMIEQVIGMLVVAGVGLGLGWRPHLDLPAALELLGVLALGLVAFTTLGLLLGVALASADAVQGIGFAVVFPLAFLGGTFVPIQGMSTVPRTLAEYNPLSALVAAVRGLTQGTASTGSWPLEHPVPASVAFCLAITAVCLPLTVHLFARASR